MSGLVAPLKLVSLRFRLGGSDDALDAERLGAALSEAELQEHWERFKLYDLDDSGFISAENLKVILGTLEISHTDEQVANMIEEVAILSGHENDGSLSFRDYIRCMDFERREAVKDGVEIAEERRLSATGAPEPAEEEAEEEAEAAEAAQEQEPSRCRRSSFAMVDMMARGRIARFEKVIEQTVSVKDDAAARRAMRFNAKLAKFQPPAASEHAVVQREDLIKRSVVDKLQAFEAANRAAATPAAFAKTWKKVGASNWKQKTLVVGGPPPKRSILDLP